ncbi:MAG: hypothetical protein N2111_13895 [Candidatus Sumerlaeaceae bacterium]|nr:hypothetical protein [Candidatus Sumerlaeaceae bacterium]
MDLEGLGVPAIPDSQAETQAEVAIQQGQANATEGGQEQGEEFRYVLPTGEKFRTDSELLEAKVEATRTIQRLNAERDALLRALQEVAQPRHIESPPQQQQQQDLVKVLYDRFVQMGYPEETAREQAELLYSIRQQIVQEVRAENAQLIGRQWQQHYEQIQASDPRFDVERNPIAAAIFRAYPGQPPETHYRMFLEAIAAAQSSPQGSSGQLSPAAMTVANRYNQQVANRTSQPSGIGGVPKQQALPPLVADDVRTLLTTVYADKAKDPKFVEELTQRRLQEYNNLVAAGVLQ